MRRNKERIMYSYATEVKYLDGYKLEIIFETGEKGIIDFSNYPEGEGVFQPFRRY